jgi:uncharacterized membrane protein (DUF485 family)
MRKSAHDMLASPEFRNLVSRRWTVSVVLLVLLFLTYYGYVLLIAYNKPLIAMRIGEVTTLGIPLGVAVIVVSWVLTAAYVWWANRAHDPEVRRLRDKARS